MKGTTVETTKGTTVLATAFTARITQLGLSRRELTARTGLSRQTLHNIEHEGRTDLKPTTLRALDEALYWVPGTCLELSKGNVSALETADANAYADKEGAYRWRIVERLQRMSLGELERMVSIMEGEQLGVSEPLSTADAMSTVEANIMAMVDRRIAALGELQNGNTAD